MIKYRNTLTGNLGVKRKSMLSNEILIKSELGKSKPRGYSSNSYHGGNVVYGRPGPTKLSDVASALNWLDIDDQKKVDNEDKHYNTIKNKNNNKFENGKIFGAKKQMKPCIFETDMCLLCVIIL
ncbi:hypothetical protein HELRODRAFT_162031 [Helobdella robusta]|uniref:Uncharacterized protein n=1 Tax=Helobdella robusta TaxID=6412 RepID=T1ES59_HELRO|nr:hypothetical protein HELRODRAFT_162031 [Helobdella robusta]ESN98598.1 hypothetical protein HELRODRAFT_162031 [Helobdella robusta]